MKIGFMGLDLLEGKVKFNDKTLFALKEKDKPKKFSPFFAEFIRDEYIQVEVVAVAKPKILDLLIHDIEKVDARLSRASNDEACMKKCMDMLEKEIPLCDGDFTEEEIKILQAMSLCSLKPVVIAEETEEVNAIIDVVLKKAQYLFFYTSGPTESRSWLVKKDSTIVACAEAIHTDLARGFIKGDVVSFDDYMKCHNFNDCRSKGFVKLVDRDYIIQPNEVIEIRFNI